MRQRAAQTIFDEFVSEPWKKLGKCAAPEERADDWFPPDRRTTVRTDHSMAHAMSLCRACPVQQTCLTYAIEYPGVTALVGIWGGTTEQQRRPLWRRFHGVPYRGKKSSKSQGTNTTREEKE